MTKSPKQSTKSVEKPLRSDPRMVDGKEVLSSRSLTVNAHLPTMGERIRRYSKMHMMHDSRYSDPDLWDDEENNPFFNEDGSPISKHEERYHEALTKAQERAAERAEAEKQAAIEAEKVAKAARKAEILEAMAEGSST